MPENIDWKFIAELEGKGLTEGYVPDASGSNSGVTIATGFDLGQRNNNDLKNLGLSESLITKLKPYLGLKGNVALKYLVENPLIITETEAADIDQKVKGNKVPTLKNRYDTAVDNTNKIKFDDLPGQAQTVIASVSFQYGNLATKTPKFWKAVTTQNWTEAVNILRNFGDSYPTRRKKEADLLEQVVKYSEQIAAFLSRFLLWWYVFLFIFFNVSCASGFSQTNSVIFNPKLAKAFTNYETSISEKRKELVYESGEKASNCLEYWKNDQATLKEDVSNMLFRSEYLVCDALQILKKNKENKVDIANEEAAIPYVKELYNRLDLSSFPSSLSQRMTDDKTSFNKLESELSPKTEKNSIVSNTKDWNFNVEIAAETDADNDGKKDLIVWVVDESKDGNYKSYSTILISDIQAQGQLKAKPIFSKTVE